MLEAQRIYIHSHSQWWPKILPLLCERRIASQLWGDLSAIPTIFNAFHLKRATGSTWQNCLKVKLKMVLFFLEELLARTNDNAFSVGSLSSITPLELKCFFLNEQNTHWPYLLPSYRGWNMVGDITKHKLEMFLEAWAIIIWPACLISLQITFLFPFSQGLIAEINGLDSWTIWFNQAILSSEWNKRSYFIQPHGNWSLHYLKKIEGFGISSKSTKWWKAYLFPIHNST